MMSLADQNLGELGGSGSVLSRQKRDHIRLDGLLNRLTSLPPEEQQPVLLEIYRLVFPHAFAEESVLWPTIRRVLPDGQQLTLRVEKEHQEINELVLELEALGPGAARRKVVLERLVGLLRQDVRDEEDLLLPRLQSRLTLAQLRQLGFTWDAVRRVAPTRAHPFVARRPPGNVLSALPLSILDRSRDRLDAMAQSRGGTFARTLSAMSSALGRAALFVERAPGMRSGEDPATRRGFGSWAGWITVGAVALVAASAAVALTRRRR